MMNQEIMIQTVLDEIDRRIKEDIQAEELAALVNYSTYHFRRKFAELTGMPVMGYITRRRLEHARYDLAQGGRIMDIALEYGFETHAGFTRAFKKCFGVPPSVHRLHFSALPPEKATVHNLLAKQGGMNMQVQLKEMEPFTIVGYASRHNMPHVNRLSDIPGYWEKINLEYGPALTTLHDTYSNSRHCEVAVCMDIDEEGECFTYMLGVGVDEADSAVPPRPGTYLHRIPGGLYAVFTTPQVSEEQYVQSIQDTWREILDNWFPQSEYEHDGTREEYEYYDLRDHGDRPQMDICIPVRKREDRRMHQAGRS